MEDGGGEARRSCISEVDRSRRDSCVKRAPDGGKCRRCGRLASADRWRTAPSDGRTADAAYDTMAILRGRRCAWRRPACVPPTTSRPTCLDTDRGRAPSVITRSWTRPTGDRPVTLEGDDLATMGRPGGGDADSSGTSRSSETVLRRGACPAGRGILQVVLACNILNQMTGLGRPHAYRIPIR